MGFGSRKIYKAYKKSKKKQREPRAEAAEGLIREDVKRQAGSGQVAFTQETRV